MDFSLNEDQLAVADMLDKLAAQFAEKPIEHHDFVLASPELDAELEANEFFSLAAVPELGPISAALAVERLARLPYAAEIALSMLVRPHLDIELPRPFAVVENGRPGRFVAGAKTLLVIDGDTIGIAHPESQDVAAVDTIYAYPMGKLVGNPEIKPLLAEQAAQVKTWLRVACAAETAGLLRAAIDCTVEHISIRQQFGRPIGTFQALRHRMAECEVLAGGVRLLALKAAASGDAGEAALAALYAQESATRVAYDMHQFFGAMGMTLEMSLHLWTYRMKALISELGGRGGQAATVADRCFTEESAA